MNNAAILALESDINRMALSGMNCADIFATLRVKLYSIAGRLGDLSIKRFIELTIRTLSNDFRTGAPSSALLASLRLRVKNLVDFLKSRI